MSRQTFVEWLMEKHWTEPTPVGDLAREYCDVLTEDEGGRAGLRRALSDYGTELWVLGAFDVAYDQYDPPPPPTPARAHAFVLWLMERHGEAETPLGVFARDLRESEVFPLRGGRRDLRRFLEHTYNNNEWVLGCFDVGWDQYEPRCSWSGCMVVAAPESSMCEGHGLL